MADVYFVMTIDTEEEWDWKDSFPKNNFSVTNTRKIPKFQRFCNELGVKPTYLIDYPVVTDEESVDYFKEPFEAGQCEIGGHLHPWCTPPVKEEVNVRNSHIVNLPVELVKKKLANLTKEIRSRFGLHPVSFRAGRWGVNGRLLKVLAQEGYKADTSVRPFHQDIGFSYQNAVEIPYWPDFDNCLKSGTQREVFELPASTGFTVKNFKVANKVFSILARNPFKHLHIIGILSRLCILQKVSLCPEQMGSREMISCVKTYLRKKNTFLNMNFHSSSLLPGGSPYVSSESDETAFYKRIKDVIVYLRSKTNTRFCTLTEARNLLVKQWS